MGRVVFMCGPAGSGKSTVARRYEQQGMTRLSFDQEAWSRGVTTMPLPPDVHRDISASPPGRRGMGDDFAISLELAAFYFDHFEAPTADEGPLTIIGRG